MRGKWLIRRSPKNQRWYIYDPVGRIVFEAVAFEYILDILNPPPHTATARVYKTLEHQHSGVQRIWPL